MCSPGLNIPADQPELCVGVMVDEPVKATGYYGGQVAAPVFKRIAERVASYLNVRPDLEPESPAAIAGPAAAVERPVAGLNGRL